MRLRFHKYHGTSNDFILVEDLHNAVSLSQEQVEALCNRRTGIGADGLMLLQSAPDFDFRMVYFNSDGRESSMCGNGGRCIAAFASEQKVIDTHATFIAFDGPHEAVIIRRSDEIFDVSLKMGDVDKWSFQGNDVVINTGSPHYVKRVKELSELDVAEEGASIRNSEPFKAEGINVNFVEDRGEVLLIRTFERGVEGETFSCGTGVTAAALSSCLDKEDGDYLVKLVTSGGPLEVRFKKLGATFSDIWLSGPAQKVFSGEIFI